MLQADIGCDREHGGYGQGGEVYLTVGYDSTLDGGPNGTGPRLASGDLTILATGQGGLGGSQGAEPRRNDDSDQQR